MLAEASAELEALPKDGAMTAEALSLFLVVASRLSEDASAQRDLARIAAEAGELDRAREAARRATELDPSDVENWLLDGAICARAGDREQAVAAYREALSRRPGDVRATAALQALGEAPPEADP